MRHVFDLLKSLLVGGILFLLPFGLIILVVEKLLALSRHFGEGIQRQLFPGAENTALIVFLAILILLLITLLAGIFARTGPGKKLFLMLEIGVLARLPAYSIIKQMLTDVGGGMTLIDDGDTPKQVVAVDFDDHTEIGFIVDHTHGGDRVVVFLPGAPTAMAGMVVIVDPDRIRPLPVKAAEVVKGMRRLGAGMTRILGDRMQDISKP